MLFGDLFIKILFVVWNKYFIFIYFICFKVIFIYFYFFKNEKKKCELIDKLRDILEIICK